MADPSEAEQAKLIAQFREQLGTKVNDVDDELKKGKEGGLTDNVLLRFLRSASWDVAKAEPKLLQWASWRASHPIGWVPKEQIAAFLSANVAFLQDLSRDGKPLLVFQVKNYLSPGDKDVFMQLLMYALDQGILAADPTKNEARAMCMVFDLSGAGMKNITLNDLKALVEILQTYYVGRLTKIWIHEAPFFFSGLWRCISPLLPPRAKTVVEFSYKKDITAKMSEFYDASVIPTQYGGQAELHKLTA